MLALTLCVCTLAVTADPWPQVETVESQPLLAQVKRVEQAMELLGNPLSPETTRALETLDVSAGDAAVARKVQALLDPYCVVAVEVAANGSMRTIATARKPELVEQGWRAFLVKVINPKSSTVGLRAESPSARPVPTSPAEVGEKSWLDLQMFTSQPLLARLSGLGLEYAVVQIYSRDAGEKTAEIGFIADTGKKQQRAVTPPANRVPIDFTARASVPVKFQVSEFDGTPTMAAFLIRDTAGRVYPSQTKRLAPDFFFHPQVYRSTGEEVRLPAGRYSVRCSRGPESVPETRELIVGDAPVEFRYTVKRWIDPASRNWWSGDHHIHAAGCLHYERPTEGVHPPDMMRHILGEDLKVGCCLTWGPCFDYQKRFFTGKPDDVSKYPYLLRYDVEVSGFGSHQSGHLNLLRLKEQIYPGGDSKNHWPTLGMNTLRWAKKQGAICGPAHSGSGLTRIVDRIEGTTDGPNRLPNFDIPAYDGIGANEFIVQAAVPVPGPAGTPVPAVDFISAMDTDRVAEWNMWYHVLNCGFRTRVSGETDFPCISGERVGMGRVYVKVDGKLDFDRWAQGIADGRSYVSDGLAHLMDFTAQVDGQSYELGVKESEIKLDAAKKVRFTVQAAGLMPGRRSIPVELIVNGYPAATKQLLSHGQTQELTFEAEITESSWVALRIFPAAHTNPFFVLVDGKPIRASKASAEWCLRGVDQCWKSKQRTYRAEEQAQAEADYNAAREIYRRIREECAK